MPLEGALSAQVYHADGRDYKGALYVSLQAGLAIVRDFTAPSGYSIDMQYGQVYGLAIGRDYGGFRAEVAYTHHTSKYNIRREGFPDTGESSQRAVGLMLNAFYDYRNSSRLTPYIGGGIGFGTVTTNTGSVAGFDVPFGSDRTGFYNAMLGANLYLNSISSIDAEYRYFNSFLGGGDFAGSHDLMIQYRANIAPLLAQFAR